jgi:hypothetical protein
MKVHAFSDLDLDIARTRIVLSLLAMVSLYVDPTTAGGLFHLTPYVLGTLLCHLAYSVGTYDQHLSEARNPRSDRTHPLRDQGRIGDRSRSLKIPGASSAEE